MIRLTFLIAACALLTSVARADDLYLRIPLTRLTLTEGALPVDDRDARTWGRIELLRPYAVLDGPGEAYIAILDEHGDPGRMRFEWSARHAILTIRAPEAPVTGSIFVPDETWTRLVPLRFSVEAEETSPEAPAAFHRAKADHYDHYRSIEAPGAAFFRHQTDLARRAAGDPAEPQRFRQPGRELADTYNLFNGGRAVSENLQLHRGLQLDPDHPAPEEVDLSIIEGITVLEYDWRAMLGDAQPALDPLASLIPADQHAAFFQTFSSLMAVLDHTTDQGLPIFRSLVISSEDARLVERYERQLGLPRTALARRLGPALIRSVAITGSDPYFPSGTDVAIIFEAADPASLRALLAPMVLAAQQFEGVARDDGEIDGILYEGVRNADRSISSYIATIGDALVVTNSPVQLARLGAVAEGIRPPLASLLEYRFFRHRYALADSGESGFIFLSDPAIRRWCGPEWRIGASRRLRAAAIMADVTAANVEAIGRGLTQPQLATADTPMQTIGELTIGPAGVASSVYGHLSFITPISELQITHVTSDEARAYRRWRDEYQRNWRWAFDPIAIRFDISDNRMSGDMTVMPLIVGSQYRTWVDAARGAVIAPDAGDPHDSIAHAVFAINIKSRAVQETTGLARMMAPGLDIDPLSWLGESVAIYADPDPFWEDLLAAEDTGEFFDSVSEIPVAIHAEVGSALRLTGFLAAVRGFIEETAPGMTAWENRTHHDRTYVRAGLSEQARAEGMGSAFDQLSIYYLASPRGLTVALSESVIRRAIDRQVARAAAVEPPQPPQPWLGQSMALQFTGAGLALVGGLDREMRLLAIQRQAWLNIPILNEWKRRFPASDPVAVHEQLWGVRLICPGGGEYVWNETYRTMASTEYGHPGEPGAGPEDLNPFGIISAGNFGLTFEDDGLRARAEIELQPRE